MGIIIDREINNVALLQSLQTLTHLANVTKDNTSRTRRKATVSVPVPVRVPETYKPDQVRNVPADSYEVTATGTSHSPLAESEEGGELTAFRRP